MSRSKKLVDVSESQIAARAYERWLGRGCPATDGTDDWFAARAELEAELRTAAPRPRKASARR